MSSFFDGMDEVPAPKSEPFKQEKIAAPPAQKSAKVDVSRRSEIAIIEELLYSEEAMSIAASLGLKADHFFHSDTRAAYRIIDKRSQDGKKTDVAVLFDCVSAAPGESKEELRSLVVALGLNGGGGTWMMTTHIEEVIAAASKRAIQARVASLANELSSGNFDAESVRAQLVDIAQNEAKQARARRSMKEHVQEAMARAEFLMKGGKPPGVTNPFRSMRKYIGTFRDGDYILVAGRPSSGKTSMALSLAAEMAMEFGEGADKKVMIVSLESPEAQVTDRLIQILAEVDLSGVAMFNDRENKAFATAMVRLSRLPIIIEHEQGMRIDRLCSTIERAVKESGVRVAFIDYVERIESTLRESAPYREKITQIAVAASKLSKRLNIPIFMLTQLSRECEKENRRPRLSDLGESGALEKEADVVIMIWKPKADVFERDAVEMNLAVEKNRDGATGPFMMEFYKYCTKYLDKPFEPPPGVMD